MKSATFGVLGLFASTAILAACTSDGAAPSAMGAASPASATAPMGQAAGVDNFMLVDQNLEAHELYRLADAKAVVLVTQTNGDAVMRGLAPALKTLKASYAGKGVEFAMLNSSLKDSREAVIAEAKTAGYDTPILLDVNQLVGEQLGVTRSAEVVVVNPKTWTVAYRGAFNAKSTAQALDAVIAGKPVQTASVMSKGAAIAFPERGATKISYAKDVAPILEAKCVACHQEGGIGPFAMTNYEMVKGFSPMIREVLRTDRMPPYNADPHVGKFSDSKNLSPAEIKTLVHWVEAGSPRGEGVDPLGAVKHVAQEWPLGKPDLVLNVPAYTIPATGRGRLSAPGDDEPADRGQVDPRLDGEARLAPGRAPPPDRLDGRDAGRRPLVGDQVAGRRRRLCGGFGIEHRASEHRDLPAARRGHRLPGPLHAVRQGRGR
jgi:hypothetical protein